MLQQDPSAEIGPLAELVLEEANWFPFAITLTALGAALWFWLRRGSVGRALHLFYGSLIGVLAGGHLLAVTVKLAHGTLEGSAALLYTMGVLFAVPAVWLAASAAGGELSKRRAVALNGSLAGVLLAFSPASAPLVLPAALNVAQACIDARGRTRLAIAAASLLVYAGLFVGSLAFLAAGGSFEDFRGME